MRQSVHHSISYIEIGVTDLAAARSFYESAFGWEFNDYGPTYCGIKSADGESEVGGLDAGTAPSEHGPLVLLYSHELDATVEAVTQAGGTIVATPYDYPGGRRFEFLDPSGNRLGVFTER